MAIRPIKRPEEKLQTRPTDNKNIVTDWLASYVYYEGAKKGFERTLITAYKRRFPHSDRKIPNFDISVEFSASEAMKSITKDGINTLAASSNQASKRIKIKMLCKDPSLAAIAAAETSSSSSTPTPTYRLKHNVEVVEPLLQYIRYCKQKASKNIILLKEKEYNPILLNYVNIDNTELLRYTVSQAYKSEEKLSDNIHTTLAEIMRGVNQETKKSQLKKELAELCATATEDDQKSFDIYLNYLNKLPNFRKTEEISEMELTTNYSTLSSLQYFIILKKNRYLLWLNRKEENTNNFRPDAVTKHYDMKLSGAILGYCEINPADSQHDVDSLCTDLIRLAIFSRNIMSRKGNKITCSLQAVVSSICDDITIMNEVISINVPMQIKELGYLNHIADELKQMGKIYDNYCLKRYISDIEDDDNSTNIALILKPKWRKLVAEFIPMAFN